MKVYRNVRSPPTHPLVCRCKREEQGQECQRKPLISSVERTEGLAESRRYIEEMTSLVLESYGPSLLHLQTSGWVGRNGHPPHITHTSFRHSVIGEWERASQPSRTTGTIFIYLTAVAPAVCSNNRLPLQRALKLCNSSRSQILMVSPLAASSFSRCSALRL